MMQENTAGGKLYVIATPIGNLEDITLRALRILKSVSLVVSEDTRHTRKLLTHFDLHPPLLSYYQGIEEERAVAVVERLRQGEDIALVSDAGTPCISDPGTILVRQARQAGFTVIPIPGPSALAAAISVAGFVDPFFLFLGFLPSSKGQRQKLLRSKRNQEYALVFYESPKRLLACLHDCLDILGDRNVFIARELTKIYEELLSGRLVDLLPRLEGREMIKGEVVVMVSSCDLPSPPQGEDLMELLVWYRDHSDLSLKEVVQQLASDLTLSRTAVYRNALQVWKK